MAWNDTRKPPSRAVSDRDRYRRPQGDGLVEVLLDGETYPGEVLGRNGPRVHVVFEKAGGRYRRWVDAAAVREAAGSSPGQDDAAADVVREAEAVRDGETLRDPDSPRENEALHDAEALRDAEA